MSKSQVLGCLWGVVRGNHYAGVTALNFGADPLNFNGPLLCRMKSGGRDTTKKGVPGSSWQLSKKKMQLRVRVMESRQTTCGSLASKH